MSRPATMFPGVPLDASMRKRLRAARRKVDGATEDRDVVIRAALAAGASSREIAAEVGLSHTWVIKIGTTT